MDWVSDMGRNLITVMPGLVPGIHAFFAENYPKTSKQDVDGRDKPGHDDKLHPFEAAQFARSRGAAAGSAPTSPLEVTPTGRPATVTSRPPP